jgi:SAM-dependent methyltransferase
MVIGRRFTLLLNAFLDNFVPPFLRDSFVFSWVARSLVRESPYRIEEFREKAFEMPASEFRRYYAETSPRVNQGATDLSPGSAAGVMAEVVEGPVLEVGCGGGWLASRLAEAHEVVATDIALHGSYVSLAHDGFRAAEAEASGLPFRDRSFPTVVCTHTLEHVTDFQAALSELRRVCAGKLVIVVPRQRPYRITFSPHLHFFPYRWSVLAYTGARWLRSLELVGGDWLLVEDHSSVDRGDRVPIGGN